MISSKIKTAPISSASSLKDCKYPSGASSPRAGSITIQAISFSLPLIFSLIESILFASNGKALPFKPLGTPEGDKPGINCPSRLSRSDKFAAKYQSFQP